MSGKKVVISGFEADFSLIGQIYHYLSTDLQRGKFIEMLINNDLNEQDLARMDEAFMKNPRNVEIFENLKPKLDPKQQKQTDVYYIYDFLKSEKIAPSPR